MKFKQVLIQYAPLLISLGLVVLTLLPEDYNLPRFFLLVSLLLIILKTLIDIHSLLLKNRIDVKEIREQLGLNTRKRPTSMLTSV